MAGATFRSLTKNQVLTLAVFSVFEWRTDTYARDQGPAA